MANRLAGATSPYLLQHADNPVDWYPWGPEALDHARAEGKPLLISIGYSACHWCHVMAHESFEDPEVAAVMNELFVNVKVDREERPDLDQIYQTAHAFLTRRSGGWPLTIFATPDGDPFHAGTYFPKHGRYGLPGFKDLLPRVAEAYRDQGDAIGEQRKWLVAALASVEPRAGEASVAWPENAPAEALAAVKRNFDPVDGGVGSAPKFPHPAELDFCLRQSALHGDAEALHVAAFTATKMAEGGIHDQLGGGFCRYSVDGQWSIPHFEKMLYDNGALLGLYADLARATGERSATHGANEQPGGLVGASDEPCFSAAARGIVDWLVREMRMDDGAFCSSLDADSEGEEGRFYVWDVAEVQALLTVDEQVVVVPHYGLDGRPNFEGHAWHLRIAAPLPEVAANLGLALSEAEARLATAKAKLLAARSTRIRPGRDDKILTSWNALMIGGLARAARAMDAPAWAELAIGATDALRRTVWRDGRLLATRKGEHAQLNAYLDDYAFLLAALIELMQTRFRIEDWTWACELAEVLLAQFEDQAEGGFFFTSHDHERLFHRSKPGPDYATPSGNGIAAQALITLGHLAAKPRYVEAGERAVRLFASALAQSPAGHPSLLIALEQVLTPPTSVLLNGPVASCAAWQRALEAMYRPSTRIINVAGVANVPPALVKGAASAGGAMAWVCQGTQCLPPVDSFPDLEALLACRR